MYPSWWFDSFTSWATTHNTPCLRIVPHFTERSGQLTNQMPQSFKCDRCFMLSIFSTNRMRRVATGWELMWEGFSPPFSIYLHNWHTQISDIFSLSFLFGVMPFPRFDFEPGGPNFHSCDAIRTPRANFAPLWHFPHSSTTFSSASSYFAPLGWMFPKAF